MAQGRVNQSAEGGDATPRAGASLKVVRPLRAREKPGLGEVNATFKEAKPLPESIIPYRRRSQLPIGRKKAGRRQDVEVAAAEKQGIMASAVLSPEAPSSFLVRALASSRGEGGTSREN